MATFLSVIAVEKPDPLAVRRDEHASYRRTKTAQHVWLELIERPYQQLVVAAIDDP